VVEEAGQRVGAGDVLDVLVGLGVAAGDRGQAGDRLERAQVLFVHVAAAGPAQRERAAQLPAPRHGDGQRAVDAAQALMADGDVALVVVGAERLAGDQRPAGRARTGRQLQAGPALVDAVARGRHGAGLVAEIDAGEVGAEHLRDLAGERVEDLVQVERLVQRAAGADDGLVLLGAGGAAVGLLHAREAGGGGVAQQLGQLDRVLVDGIRRIPARKRDAAHGAVPGDREKQGGDRAGGGDQAARDVGAAVQVGHGEREAGRDHAGHAGRAVEADVVLTAGPQRDRVAVSAGVVLRDGDDVELGHAEQLGEPVLQRGDQLRGRARVRRRPCKAVQGGADPIRSGFRCDVQSRELSRTDGPVIGAPQTRFRRMDGRMGRLARTPVPTTRREFARQLAPVSRRVELAEASPPGRCD
jgi:hypothetical protein